MFTLPEHGLTISCNGTGFGTRQLGDTDITFQWRDKCYWRVWEIISPLVQ